MSYDNAEPEVLKTLNSSGQVLDDQGNVVQEATDFWKQKYEQAEPKVAKYLHADGTIDENPGSGGGGGGADLEDNKEATIDVSTYTEPVEITPTAGKDGMKKATVTLSNIPSGGSDIPSVMELTTYDSDSLLLFEDETKLTRLFASDQWNMGGWIDDISQMSVGENGLLISQIANNLPFLCVEYDNKMYKAPAEVPNYYEKYNFVEVQSQATSPTSDTPSGAVASGTVVHLSTTETDGTIYYSDDDSIFRAYDDSYGIRITQDTTIKAVVAVGDKFTSEYLELTYTVE